MPEPRPPFPSQSDSEVFTIRISKMSVANGLLAVAVVVALVALGLRERAKSQTALASTSLAPSPQEPAVVSSTLPVATRPAAARPEAIAETAEPMSQVENQAQNERPADFSAPRQSEAAVVEVRTSQFIFLDPPATDSASARAEVKPEDPPQPADQPNQPSAPSPRTSDPSPARPTASSTTLNGAGATYPYPIYSKWFDDYHKLNPQVQFNYQAVGNAAGVNALLKDAIDFGATDVSAYDEQLSLSKPPILHIPTVLGAIVPIYNIPGVGREVRFTPEMLAGIYLGKIVSWSDPAIANSNRDASFPNLPIVVVHRANGSAATFVFTDYLSKVSPEWQERVGKGPAVNWPVGLGAKGNEGVAALVRQTPGAIAYEELLYVEQNPMPFGHVQNAAGNFVKASLRTVTEAGASVTELPPNSGISITNASGKEAYPIASFTWLLVRRNSNEPSKSQDIASFLGWMIDAGQPLAENLGYAPIPRKLTSQVKKIIAQIR